MYTYAIPMNIQKQNKTFFCFNPLVTFISGTVELALALFVCLRYNKTLFGRLTTLLLILLAVFQFSEYTLCSGNSSLLWSKLGFVATTFLPAIGLHLTSLITRKTFLTPISYVLATAIAVHILLLPTAFVMTYCTGTYVLFELNDTLHYFFGIYYLLFLLVAILKLAFALLRKRGNGKIILWLLLGYSSFLIPTIIVLIITSASHDGIPSIMCGFAVLLACVLTFKVVPLYKQSFKDQSDA